MLRQFCVVMVIISFFSGLPMAAVFSSSDPSLETTQLTTFGSKSQVSEVNIRDGPGMRPIDKGLQPLYIMTNRYLDIVHPDSKEDWIDDQRFEKAFTDGDVSAGVRVIYKSFQNDWQFWARHYVGFTVCIIVGLLFVIVMPVVGLCFCCCRLRGRCGAKREAETKKSYGCQRATLGIFLILLTTLITAGMVCAFVTNELMHQQTSSKANSMQGGNNPGGSDADAGFLPTIIDSLRRIESYRGQTIAELQNGILLPIERQDKIIRKQLLDFPDQAREKLAALTNSGQILLTASALSSSLEEISANLGRVQTYIETLRQLQAELNHSLVQSKTNIINALPEQCQYFDECRRLKNQVNGLNVTVDFSQSQSVSSQLTAVQSVIDNDFKKMIEEGKLQYSHKSDQILNGTRDTIADFEKTLGPFVKNAREAIDDINSASGQRMRLNDTATFLAKTVSPKVKQYGDYRYYVGISLSCVLLLVVVCTYLGLCFGACGEAAGDDAQTCNRGVGATFLMAGIGFTFLFSWLLMVAVVCLFVVGGASYTEVCRPVLLGQNKAFMKVGERLLAAQLSQTQMNFTISSLLSNCENDNSIYEAVNLDGAINVTGQFNNLRHLLRSSVDALVGQIRPNFSSVVIAKTEILNSLESLKAAQLDDIQFASYESLLSQPITNANVSSLADELFNASKNPYLNRDQSLMLVIESQRLRNTSRVIIEPMINISKSLKSIMVDLKSEVVPHEGSDTFANRTQDLIEALLNTQDFIRFNLSGLVVDYINNFIQNFRNSSLSFINGLQYEIKNNIGRCRVLYDEFRTVSVSICHSFVSPFNGFWFSIGWCLFFSIPSIILSVKLVTLYRKTEGWTFDSKSLDDPFHEAYSGINTADNIPLDDVPQLRRFKLPGLQGHQNPVFDGSDDPRSPTAEDTTYGRPPPATFGRVFSDPGFVHPLYSSQFSAVRPGHRHPQRNSCSTK